MRTPHAKGMRMATTDHTRAERQTTTILLVDVPFDAAGFREQNDVHEVQAQRDVVVVFCAPA